MSRTKKSKVAPGKEWWSRRPMAYTPVQGQGLKKEKRICHQIERHQAKEEIRSQLNEIKMECE